MVTQGIVDQWHQTIANKLISPDVGLLYPTHPQWNGVTLVAVTKYATVEQMLGAFAAGLTHFGESKPVEALQKRATLPEQINQAITWHFIGNLQRNKVSKVVGHYALIHSVDSFELLEAIAKKAAGFNIVQSVLLQINLSTEPTKNGFPPKALETIFKKAEKLDSIGICGLMTMAPKEATPREQAEIFGRLQQLKQQIEQKEGRKLAHLSMGMTQDYSQALLQGATIVRIGNKLFT
jgi:pyridoxal phosphate enzyme (YggS family)